MSEGYVMIDFAGKTTGTDAELAGKILDAIASGKLIIGYNISGQTPVVMAADSNGVLKGGGVTVSVSGTTVTIRTPAVGTVSDIKIINGDVTKAISANGVGSANVSLTVPEGYSVVGLASLVVTGATTVPALTIRGWRLKADSTALEVFYGNPSEATAASAKFEASVMIGIVVPPANRETEEQEEQEKTIKKGK